MPAFSRACANGFPPMPLGVMSTSKRWLSVPPVIRLKPLLASKGFNLITGGTDNHLLLVDMTPKGIGGKPFAQALEKAGIVANYNAIPFDPRKPMDPSGVRLGTPAISSRG